MNSNNDADDNQNEYSFKSSQLSNPNNLYTEKRKLKAQKTIIRGKVEISEQNLWNFYVVGGLESTINSNKNKVVSPYNDSSYEFTDNKS